MQLLPLTSLTIAIYAIHKRGTQKVRLKAWLLNARKKKKNKTQGDTYLWKDSSFVSDLASKYVLTDLRGVKLLSTSKTNQTKTRSL